MIAYSAQFPVNDKFDKTTFVDMVIKWNQGSKYDKFENLCWDGETIGQEWSEEKKQLCIDELPHKNIVASRFQKEDEHGLWKTDFILNLDLLYLTVRVALETTEFTTDFYPTYYPPFLVKQVIYKGFAGIDGILPVDKIPYSLDDKADYVDLIISGEKEFALPIVFCQKRKLVIFRLTQLNWRLSYRVLRTLFTKEMLLGLIGTLKLLVVKRKMVWYLYTFQINI